MAHPVRLFVYDLSNGLAAQLSQQLTGRYFRAIFHTGIVVYDREYFFGGGGIESSLPGRSPYGTPIERLELGRTEVTPALWHEFLEECGEAYGVGKYHLLEHNCNTFSNAASNFLLGIDIPAEITALPEDFLRTPLGMMLRPQIDARYSPAAATGLREEATAARPQTLSHAPASTNGQSRANGAKSSLVTFTNTPTIAKLCGKMKEQAPELDTALLTRVLNGLIKPSTQPLAAQEQERVADELKKYFGQVSVEDSFAGLDALRILLLDPSFAQSLPDELLELAISRDYAEYKKALLVLARALANGSATIPDRLHAALAKTDAYAVVSVACQHDDRDVSAAGVAAAHNLVLTSKGTPSDDFALGLATSLADRLDRASDHPDTVGAWSEETRRQVTVVVDELRRRGSVDCKEVLASLAL